MDDPPPTYETNRAGWLALSAFHLLYLSFYAWMHTDPDMLKQGHYVWDLLFGACELLLFSFSFIGEMPRPDEKLAVAYAYTVIANGLMAISFAYFEGCPFSLNAAEFIWLPLAGYMVGYVKNDIRREFISNIIESADRWSS